MCQVSVCVCTNVHIMRNKCKTNRRRRKLIGFIRSMFLCDFVNIYIRFSLFTQRCVSVHTWKQASVHKRCSPTHVRLHFHSICTRSFSNFRFKSIVEDHAKINKFHVIAQRVAMAHRNNKQTTSSLRTICVRNKWYVEMSRVMHDGWKEREKEAQRETYWFCLANEERKNLILLVKQTQTKKKT